MLLIKVHNRFEEKLENLFCAIIKLKNIDLAKSYDDIFNKFANYFFTFMKNLKIALASDHAGFNLKKSLINFLKNDGHFVKDFGTFSDESVDYPDFAHPLALAVENNEYDFGITLCGSGNGISMTANKHQGIRAALCWCVEIAKLARQHNDANVCSIPARFVSEKEAIDIITEFINNDFEKGRHLKRIKKIPII